MQRLNGSAGDAEADALCRNSPLSAQFLDAGSAEYTGGILEIWSAGVLARASVG